MNQPTDWQARAKKAEVEVEETENRVDEEWLNAIGEGWKLRTGNYWETLDGETREEGISHNIGKLFQAFDEQKEELERLKAACAEMREALQAYREALRSLGELSQNRVTYFDAKPTKNEEALKRWMALNNAGVMAEKALSTDAGRDYTMAVKGLIEALTTARDLLSNPGGPTWFKIVEALDAARDKGLTP